MDNPIKKFAIAGLWSSCTSYGSLVLNFLGQLWLANLLFTDDFGIYAYCLAWREILFLLFSFAQTKNFIQSPGTIEDLSTNLWMAELTGLCAVILSLLISLFFVVSQQSNQAWLFFLVTTGQALTYIGSVYLAPKEKQLDYKFVSLIRSGSLTLSLYLAIFLAYLDFGLWALAAREVLWGACTLLFARIYHAQSIPRLPLKQLKKTSAQHFNFGIKNQGFKICESLFLRLPDIVIGSLFSHSILGYFYQARYIASIPIKLSEPFSQQVLFSLFSAIKDTSSYMQRVSELAIVLTLSLMPVAMLTYLSSEWLILTLLGERWLPSAYYLEQLSLYMILVPSIFCLANAAICKNKHQIAATSYLIASLVCIFLIWVLEDKQSIAWCISLSALITFALNIIQLKLYQHNRVILCLLAILTFIQLGLMMSYNAGLFSCVTLIAISTLSSRSAVKNLIHEFRK